MKPFCDNCGRKFRAEDGQVTADTVLCGECLRRFKESLKQGVRHAATQEPPGPCLCRVRGTACNH